MRKSILFAFTGDEFNHKAADYLLTQGHLLAIYAPDPLELEQFSRLLSAEKKERCFFLKEREITEASVLLLPAEAEQLVGNLDVYIYGLSRVDEEAYIRQEADKWQKIKDKRQEGENLRQGDNCNQEARSLPSGLGEEMVLKFRHLFWLSREVARLMIKQKKGDMIFLLFDHLLYYGGYPSSPVYNEGVISFVKSLAKELSPFYVQVNALAFGYYDHGLRGAEKRKMRKKLEMFTLKPPLLQPEEMLAALELLVNPPVKHWTGQVIHTSPAGR